MCIAEHTVDTDLLRGGWVLDAGCRNFTFSRELARRGCKVLALDADPTVEDPRIDGVIFANLALTTELGERELVMHHDPQARYLVPAGSHYQSAQGTKTEKVRAINLEGLMIAYNIDEWDAIKLDIEGSEYAILNAFPGPVAQQISIEFHEHVRPQPQKIYDAIFRHLGQWYRIVQHEKEARHCCAPNFWDTLLVHR